MPDPFDGDGGRVSIGRTSARLEGAPTFTRRLAKAGAHVAVDDRVDRVGAEQPKAGRDLPL